MRRDTATRRVASAAGILVGLAGVEHGFFEVLQGNIAPSSMMIEAIGPAQRLWEYGTERALTIIPNLFVTGILAISLGFLVVTWAGAFIDRRHGASTFLLLSVTLWLAGGGFAPIFMSVLAGATATRIGRPLNWWRAHLSGGSRGFLAKSWPWSMIGFVLVFSVSVEIAVFGYPLVWLLGADAAYAVQSSLGFIAIGLMVVSIPTAFAYDTQERAASGGASTLEEGDSTTR